MGLLAIAEERLRQNKVDYASSKNVKPERQKLEKQKSEKLQTKNTTQAKTVQKNQLNLKTSEKMRDDLTEKKPNIKPQMIKQPAAKSITTVFDEIVEAVQQKPLDLREAAAKYGVKEDKIEEWAKILEDHDLIKIYYPAIGKPRMIK